MTAAEWIAEKVNNACGAAGVFAMVELEDVVFVRRDDKPDARVGIIPTSSSDSQPIVSLDEVKRVHAQNPTMTMMIAIPSGTRWSGTAIRWLQSKGVAFGGVGDLLSTINRDNNLSTYRNRTFAFVEDGLRQHSRVIKFKWIDSKKAEVILCNSKKIVVGVDNAYDITMSVARDAARNLGNFDVLLKVNPNGSITLDAAQSVERLGFQVLNWGDLLAYLAKRSR